MAKILFNTSPDCTGGPISDIAKYPPPLRQSYQFQKTTETGHGSWFVFAPRKISNAYNTKNMAFTVDSGSVKSVWGKHFRIKCLLLRMSCTFLSAFTSVGDEDRKKSMALLEPCPSQWSTLFPTPSHSGTTYFFLLTAQWKSFRRRVLGSNPAYMTGTRIWSLHPLDQCPSYLSIGLLDLRTLLKQYQTVYFMSVFLWVHSCLLLCSDVPIWEPLSFLQQEFQK